MKAMHFPNGLTVRELKDIVNDLPDTNPNGDECEVWMESGPGLSSPVTSVWPLNQREESGEVWQDIIFEHG